MTKREAYFLVGPTAVGKSSIAQQLAERHQFDIISADSMLIYKGMDIGTAKPTVSERSRVKYWCVDLATATEPFSAWTYVKAAHKALDELTDRSRRAIVVGGTGLYVKSLTDGIQASPAPGPEFRAYWSQVLREHGVSALQKALREKDPKAYDALQDKQNGRRLIRALEIAETGTGPAERNWRDQASSPPIVGLSLAPPRLRDKIEERVKRMYDNGLLDEVRGLLAEGFDVGSTAGQAIGYAEAIAFLNKRCSLEEAMAKTIVRTRQLAKRQMTWFRRQANVQWVNADNKSDSEIADLVMAEWQRIGPTPIADMVKADG